MGEATTEPDRGHQGALTAAVVITNYNYANYVSAAMASVIAQTVPARLVVVDDGSVDASLAAIERFAADHPAQVEMVAKANGGQASAFNAGWEHCSADVVFFLDGDDELEPDAVESVLAAFEANPEAERVQFRMGWVDGEGRALDGSFPEADRLLPAGDLRPVLTTRPDDVSWQPTTGNAFRASVLARLLPMPEEPYRISADHYLSNLSALYGPVLAIERNLARYRVHGDNADHRNDFDLERQRSILARTEETRRHLIERGSELGLAMPSSTDGFESLTTAAMRLISSRFDGHPFPGDSRLDLVVGAARAGMGRSDFPPARRAAVGMWAVLVGYGPKRFVPALSARALTR